MIIGAGAIGGTVGGRLAESGHEVLLVARGANAKAIKADGLTVALPARAFTVRPPVVESVAELELRRDDVLVLAVKSHQSEALLAELAELPVGSRKAGDVIPVLCFQNGVNNELLALRYFAEVHGVCLALPTTYLEPGRVEAHGAPQTGVLEIGRYPNGFNAIDERVSKDLSSSGILTEPRGDVMAWKRSKLLQNLGNALEPLCGPGLTEEEIVLRSAISEMARAEGAVCLSAAGLEVVDPELRDARLNGKLKVMPVGGRARQGGSTWQSIARGVGSVETDFLNGEIVLLGRIHGVPTPVNRELQSRMADLAHHPDATTVLPSELLEAFR